MYSRLAIIFILLLAQIIILYFFILTLNKNFEIYLGGSLALSFGFMVYLSNCKGKNEFKIVWMLPLMLFPLFGIATYLLYHMNIGAVRMKKNLALVKQKTDAFHKADDEAAAILQKYPDASGLGTYLMNTGHFYPHEDNLITYFRNGEECAPHLHEDIARAKHFIFLEFFIILLGT